MSDAAAEEVADWEIDAYSRARVASILAEYVPEWVHVTDPLLRKYKGREEELMDALERKFGPEPAGPTGHLLPDSSLVVEKMPFSSRKEADEDAEEAALGPIPPLDTIAGGCPTSPVECVAAGSSTSATSVAGSTVAVPSREKVDKSHQAAVRLMEKLSRARSLPDTTSSPEYIKKTVNFEESVALLANSKPDEQEQPSVAPINLAEYPPAPPILPLPGELAVFSICQAEIAEMQSEMERLSLRCDALQQLLHDPAMTMEPAVFLSSSRRGGYAYKRARRMCMNLFSVVAQVCAAQRKRHFSSKERQLEVELSELQHQILVFSKAL